MSTKNEIKKRIQRMSDDVKHEIDSKSNRILEHAQNYPVLRAERNALENIWRKLDSLHDWVDANVPDDEPEVMEAKDVD